ncbi:MAG: PfkB family carbohydrate kinase [Candidatus Micrarchaeota archaeon]|nr:PfkB family carbohydrate kinase [Candidatus Micrarchaeota archaeon]
MDLFAIGTPVMDLFARVGERELAALGATKGATNFYSVSELAKIERSISRKISYRYPGDNARNVCEGFAALGGFCGYAGTVGDDLAGAEFAANLQECGVGNFLQEKRGATGKILALVTPDKQRTFCAHLGVSTEYGGADGIAAKNARMLYVSSITLCGDHPASRACRACMEEFRKAGKKIALALESPPMVEKNREMLLALVKKYASVLFLNEDEAAALLGAGKNMEKKLAALIPNMPVYLKRGGNGSTLFIHGRAHHLEAMKARALDTTGAGDAYAAGALYGLARGYTPLSSAKIGCYLATKVVEKFGAGVPLRHARMAIKHQRGKR